MHSGLVRALVPVSLCLGLGLPAAVGHQRRDIVVVGRVTDSSQGRALANAQVKRPGIDIDTLYVSRASVDQGPNSHMRRWRPRAMGRATRVAKGVSHIHLELDEL